ncbi:FCD domain-containing protein [Streptomyces phaeochromogenes]|nr:FCD domain-containing protein [Streptomyces phaeochromogenes]WRZ26377.1 FCD domain-containing protein [Streptomyces phaeochromogenes]WSJ11258.1 FCD domain-containing protein [Streptomyces phaeochromogenes]
MWTGEAPVFRGVVQAHLGTERSTNFAIGLGQARHSSGADSLHRPRRASWVAFRDVIMRASGNRIVRGVVRALESQVVNTAWYMGRPERAMCVASNRGHRRVYERIAAHDPSGVAEAMCTHITEARARLPPCPRRPGAHGPSASVTGGGTALRGGPRAGERCPTPRSVAV